MIESERIPYLKTLMYIAASDDDIADEEVEFFVDAGSSYGISHSEVLSIKNEVIDNEESLEEIVSGITEEETKMELICDLLTICYVDGTYSILEQAGLRAVCEIMDLDESRLIALEEEAEESFKKENNPFNLFKKNSFRGKMLSGLKKAVDSSKAGTIIVGRKMKKGGSAVARSVTLGIGFAGNKLSASIESAKKLREENKALREKLQTNTVSEKVKQKVITQLNSKVSTLSAQLKMERERNRRNEEMIELLQAQIDDLTITLDVAQNAKTA